MISIGFFIKANSSDASKSSNWKSVGFLGGIEIDTCHSSRVQVLCGLFVDSQTGSC